MLSAAWPPQIIPRSVKNQVKLDFFLILNYNIKEGNYQYESF